MTSIQSRPPKTIKGVKTMSFNIDFFGAVEDANVKQAIQKITQFAVKDGLVTLGSKAVPWFPTRIDDFNLIGKRILSEGDGIQEADHPGFHDLAYRKRREQVCNNALDYQMHQPIPSLVYTSEEKETWKFCYTRLIKLFKTHACQEFNWTIDQFQKEVGFKEDDIPQLEDISQFLKSRTGWRLKPVGGLLTQREFLNGLAFKIFHSTQYIRHHSAPLYTPEPDIVHELLGHAPMFAH